MAVGGRPLEVDTRKAIAVLAMLVVNGRQSREALATLLWPDSAPERGRAALRRTLSVLNSGLGGERLHADRASVELALHRARVDVHRFDRLLAGVTAHDHVTLASCQRCLDDLVTASALHRGPFLEGFTLRGNPEFDDWIAAREEFYRRELCGVLDRLTTALVEQDELDQSATLAGRWLAVDPMNEQVHVRLMLLHAWRGERGAAIARYRELVGLLDRELSVAPLASTTAVYDAILEGRIERPGDAPELRPTKPRSRATPVATDLPYVGRSELEQEVREHLEAPVTVAALIEGEAGIGKTRFVEQLEAGFHRAGRRVLATRCHPSERRTALAPIIELVRGVLADGRGERHSDWVLSEASRLVPELIGRRRLPAPAPLEAPGARQRFHEAIRSVLETTRAGAKRRTVLVVEDAHFADEATLEFLAHLCTRLDEHRLSPLITFRSEEVGPQHPLRHLASGPAEDVRRWALPRLEGDAVSVLAEVALGSGDGLDAIIDQLVHETEGVPLAVVEYLRWLVDHRPEPGTPWPIPSGLREAIERRVHRLSDTAQQLLSTSAVIGHRVSPAVLSQAAGRNDDEVVSGLEELVQRRMLHSRGDDYEFAHDKIRSIVYDNTSPARRRLLHARVAEALAPHARRRQGGELAAVVADHARLGGRSEDAAHWSLLAGDHALRMLAHGDADAHYERALELDHPEPALVHRRLARSRVLNGDYAGALESYEAAAAHCTTDRELSLIEHELGVLHLRQGEWGLAQAHLDSAGDLLHGENVTEAARIAADLGLLALNLGDLEQAAQQARQALELAEVAEDRHALAQARNLAGLVARRRGETTEAHRHLEHAAALAASLPDPSAYIAALNNLALSTLDAGEHARAEQLLRTALDRCDRLGDRHRKAAILNNLADLHHLRGDDEDTMTLLKEAVALFADVGRTSLREPEIWKLTEW
ncbi:MAG: tetratricopeptide repeat protein [Nitriliruptorales bacterium]|nr:tetratricopeptide repeat protein [Nitriliruptorales bacterium]